MKTAIAGIALAFACLALGQTHQHSTMSSQDGRFNPFSAPDGKDGFYLAYIERTGGKSNLFLRHTTDGKELSPPVRVNDQAGDAVVRNENPPKLALGPQGEVYACWANERARWKGNIRFARSTDGGKTFSPAVNLNSDAGGEPAGHAFQSIAVDSAGRIHVAWIDERAKKSSDRGAEIRISTSQDGGRTFSPDRRVVGDVCECCRTTLQTDSAGRLLVSYRKVPAQGPMYRDIVVARSDDGGRSFTPTVVSRDGWEIPGCPVAGPALSLDSQDKIVVVWFTGGAERPGLYFATSTDQGTTWSARRLLDPERKLGKHAHAVSAGNRVLVAWDDLGEPRLTAWGFLDFQHGAVRKIASRQGMIYPTVAMNRNGVFVAGARISSPDIAWQFDANTP